ncbi:MAG: hydrogenase expression/formation protein HypE [Deltaproteobacteria bacterium]|nr:hydrogenase expression/formation protein HypE [Deltaproteobacteria bacterium]
MHEELIRLGHGGGGHLTADLIHNLFLEKFRNPILENMNDSATMWLGNREISFTTDSYVVNPLFFPGGNIGSLAVCGTINDLAMSGARPLYLSAGYIIEEGFPMKQLAEITETMAQATRESEVLLVTGDTKVVPRGMADGLYINTAGIGIHDNGPPLTPARIEPGDAILINGTTGDHGAAVINGRDNTFHSQAIVSDVAALHVLVEKLREENIELHCLRDVTRGGLGGILAELARQAGKSFIVKEEKIGVAEAVRALCEIYGFDPLYLANEGKMVIFCAAGDEERALSVMRRHRLGEHAASIGRVLSTPSARPQVILETMIGGHRVIDLPMGDLVPRIC